MPLKERKRRSRKTLRRALRTLNENYLNRSNLVLQGNTLKEKRGKGNTQTEIGLVPSRNKGYPLFRNKILGTRTKGLERRAGKKKETKAFENTDWI